jgi:hypothetical protein
MIGDLRKKVSTSSNFGSAILHRLGMGFVPQPNLPFWNLSRTQSPTQIRRHQTNLIEPISQCTRPNRGIPLRDRLEETNPVPILDVGSHQSIPLVLDPPLLS